VATCGGGSNYTITQAGGQGLLHGVSLLPNSQCYACSVTIGLPFTYYLYGQPYNSVHASTNGTIDFVAASNNTNNTCLPNNAAFSNAILAHWDDIWTNTLTCFDCGIYISLQGTAPNRIFVVEWRAILFSNDDFINFEVRLYEGQNRFDIVYGEVGGRGSGATIGVERSGGIQYTQFSCNTNNAVNSGTQLIFTQPACPTFTPTLTPTITPTLCPGCPTYTVTGTPTVTPLPTCVGTDYQITAQSGATFVPGTTNVNLICNSCGAPLQLPFTYNFYGEPYDFAFATAHGTLQFNSSFNSASNNACLPYPFFINTIAAFWDQMDLMQSGQGIFTSTTGIAPNRVFNIEWRGCLFQAGGCRGDLVSFEIRLFEGQDRFDIVYGNTVSSGGSGATVGVQRDNGANWTEYECNTGGIDPGLQLTFTLGPCTVRIDTPTRTPTRTFTPTRTPTITITPTPSATAVLTGHVTWQGRPAQPNALQQLPITLTLKLGATETAFGPITTDAFGFFTVPMGTLPSGTYSWRVKGPKFLANGGTFDVTGAPTYNVEMGLLQAGDANNDNRITALDFGIVRASFGLGTQNPGYDDRADFTGDQIVNTTDFNLLKINFGLGGSPPLNPAKQEPQTEHKETQTGVQK
jgi:hypothetical protein